jgi:K+-sensing histidine kinase KdpD
MISREFFNLIENAIRHRERGIAITICRKSVPNGRVMPVENNDTGVSPRHGETIFDKGCRKITGFGLFPARVISDHGYLDPRDRNQWQKGCGPG